MNTKVTMEVIADAASICDNNGGVQDVEVYRFAGDKCIFVKCNNGLSKTFDIE